MEFLKLYNYVDKIEFVNSNAIMQLSFLNSYKETGEPGNYVVFQLTDESELRFPLDDDKEKAYKQFVTLEFMKDVERFEV